MNRSPTKISDALAEPLGMKLQYPVIVSKRSIPLFSLGVT